MDKKVGVLGGGQLGRMLIQAATDLAIDLRIMDVANCPCSATAPVFFEGDIRDFESVIKFGEQVDILTIEIENVNVDALEVLEEKGIKVYPQPRVIRLIQDKGLQKQFYEKIKVPTAPYHLISEKSELAKYPDFFPAMQKLRKGGYDGKGVQVLRAIDSIDLAFTEPSVLESFVELDKELSVIIARNEAGEIVSFPIVEQAFNSEANLVEFLFSPASVSKQVAEEASNIAKKIIESLDMVGLLAVEFFLDKNGSLFVNEVAPRPHNSGHQTIEGNYTSQFQQHLRSICGFPLGDTSITFPSVMINLLGEKNHEGIAVYEGLADCLKLKGVYPHIYGKVNTKPFRKMGHITVINPDLSTAKQLAKKVKETIKVIGK